MTKLRERKQTMAKFDLESLSIDELATLRDAVTAKLSEKVTARQVELEAEMMRLSQFGAGKVSKKAAAAVPAAKTKKSQDKKTEEVSEDGDVPEAA
jgi:hypothetical protein